MVPLLNIRMADNKKEINEVKEITSKRDALIDLAEHKENSANFRNKSKQSNLQLSRNN